MACSFVGLRNKFQRGVDPYDPMRKWFVYYWWRAVGMSVSIWQLTALTHNIFTMSGGYCWPRFACLDTVQVTTVLWWQCAYCTEAALAYTENTTVPGIGLSLVCHNNNICFDYYSSWSIQQQTFCWLSLPTHLLLCIVKQVSDKNVS